ncbi:MAG: ADP-ribosylglycohydrolase family protein [Clostridia bacterium]|nr:ADP-ribosylglycohydrolase family protein [Clostridia bacterium]
MIGAIIGDLAGSVYEFAQTKKVKSVKIKSIIEDNAFFSDDTILTLAVLDAIINKKDYGTTLKSYAQKYANYMPDFTPYFKTIFSPNFTNWSTQNVVGKSCGNGAMMRISPVGFLFDNVKEIKANVKLATKPSHNTKQAIKSATTVALIIYYFRHGLTKQEVVKKLKLKITKPTLSTFNYTCKDTLPICLYALFNSTSFENAIKLAISFGGDTDTNACIVGGMAEALYGVDKNLKTLALKKLPKEFQTLLNKFYKQHTNQK